MNNPMYELAREEVRKHLARLDKVLEAAGDNPEIKEAVNKTEFYTGLKFGENKSEGGIITHLYEMQGNLIDKNVQLELRVHSLEQDARNLSTAVNNMHKYLVDHTNNQAYYNQSRWHEVSNTLSKYGEY